MEVLEVLPVLQHGEVPGVEQGAPGAGPPRVPGHLEPARGLGVARAGHLQMFHTRVISSRVSSTPALLPTLATISRKAGLLSSSATAAL